MRKNILITGASAGLGKEMARQFAAMGRNLALCARRADRLQALQNDLLARHPDIRVEVEALDVCDDDQVFKVFHRFAEQFGTLDRVVVNAGVGKGQRLGTGAFAANRETLQTNLIGALAQMEAAMEIFRQQKAGHLVTVASVAAMRGLPNTFTAYAASKAGLAALSEGLRADLLRTPIRVTTLYPGYIESDMTAETPAAPFIISTARGVRGMIAAMEKERPEAFVPAWPWAVLGPLLRRVPLAWLARAA